MLIKLMKKCYNLFRNLLTFSSELFLPGYATNSTQRDPWKTCTSLAGPATPTHTQSKVLVLYATFS